MCILGSPVLDNGIEASFQRIPEKSKISNRGVKGKKKKHEIVVKEVLFVFNRIRT